MLVVVAKWSRDKLSDKIVSEVRLNYFWRVLVIGALLFVVERLIEPILPPRCFLAAQQAVVNPSCNLIKHPAP